MSNSSCAEDCVRVFIAHCMRCSAVASTMRETAISRSLFACRIISGASLVVVTATWLMSGKMLGTRP